MPHQKRWPVLITSYETLRSYAKVVSKAGVDLLVCDEAHRLKNAKVGGLLRTSTRPQMNLLLLRASVAVSSFTLKESHAPVSIGVLVINHPPRSQ